MLLKPYIKNANGQETDKKLAKKNPDNVSDEKPTNAKTLGKSNCESNCWNILPDELLEKILLCTIERSGYTLLDHKIQTHHSIFQTCRM